MPSFTTPLHESNDCHAPAGTPAGGQFCGDGSSAIWKTPRDQYAPWPGLGDNPSDADFELFRAHRRRQHAWEHAARVAIATGEVTPEEADRLAGSPYVLRPSTERHIWEPLPETLYHVTTNKAAVLEQGLSPRSEREGSTAIGLGGGDDEAVSFTTDKEYAKVIQSALLGLHDIATGKTTVADLVKAAEEGVGAKRPYINELRKFIKSSYGDFDAWAEGWEQQGDGFAVLASKIPAGAKPIGPGWMGRDEMAYHGYMVRMSPERRVETATHAYNAWLTARQEAGGPENPWFTFNDPAALAKVPRAQIVVLEVTTKPGTMGWFVSPAEREWRTSTGKVAKSIRVVDK